ncbi:hypothetical protein TNCT_408401 [Trichonephila clavata]|uniref:Uncharacterized protein n=1 Tax=Trichonephila clavata TaxID=2740835 RepID=A0A8X6FVU6_TRICU|nr:hypothetical protein TNCT_408401 [Trichonephila clavata]
MKQSPLSPQEPLRGHLLKVQLFCLREEGRGGEARTILALVPPLQGTPGTARKTRAMGLTVLKGLGPRGFYPIHRYIPGLFFPPPAVG